MKARAQAVAFAVGFVVGASACAQPAEAPVAGSASSPTPAVRRAASRPPRQLCARELAHLEEQATFVDGLLLPGPPAADGKVPPPLAPSALETARAAPPTEPTRKVMLEETLADDWIVEAIVLPNFVRKERVDRPSPGEIARIDARGARGDVVALVRRKLTGGLYDYVGSCQVGRAYLEVLPQKPPSQRSPSDHGRAQRVTESPPPQPTEITIRVSESSGHVYVDVVGGDVTPSYMEW